MSRKDEIVEAIHAERAQYAAEFDFDVARIIEDLKAQEASTPLRRATLSPLKPSQKT